MTLKQRGCEQRAHDDVLSTHMKAIVMDQSVFADPLLGQMTGSHDMACIFTGAKTLQYMLDVEAALAQTQAALGIIPAEAAVSITSACNSTQLNPVEIGKAAADAGNIAIPFVKALTAAVEGDAKRFVHWGATSQDIIDTALVLQLRDGLLLIETQMTRLASALAKLAEMHRQTPMPGRTWLQHALPVTFGLKAAGWLDALTRHRIRLGEVRPRLLSLQFGGAAGTLASLGGGGILVLEDLAKRLKLTAPAIPWHANRDRIAEIGAYIGLIIGTTGKIARDLSLLMQTDVGEAFEPAASGRGGSSTMPHKRNPVLCAAILSVATSAPGKIATLLSAQVQEHERSAGNWAAEWRILPELMIDTAGVLERSITLIEGVEPDVTRMRANLETTQGLVLAEAAMMALAPFIGRAEAHHLVDQASKQALVEHRHLDDVLSENHQVTQHLDAAALARIFNPLNYLGASDTFIDRVLSVHKDITAKIRSEHGESA